MFLTSASQMLIYFNGPYSQMEVNHLGIFQTINSDTRPVLWWHLILSASWYNQTSSFPEKTYCIVFSHTLLSSAWPLTLLPKVYKEPSCHSHDFLFLWNASKKSSFVVIFMFKKFLDISSAGFEIQQIYSQRKGKRKIRVSLRPFVKWLLFKTTLY